MSDIRVGICLHMTGNVIGSWISRGIASETCRVSFLVDADIVKSHRRWHQSRQPGQVERGETSSHAKIHDNCHRLRWDSPLTDIAIGTERARIEFPDWFVCNRPNNVSFLARGVVEIVFLIAFTIVPVVIDIRQPRQRLLVNTALIRVQKRHFGIINLNEVLVKVLADEM